MAVECKNCGAEFDSEQGAAIHWGAKHTGPNPYSQRVTMECERCGDEFRTYQPENRRQCSDCFQEHGHTASYKERMRRATEGNHATNGMQGKTHDESSKQKTSQALEGREFTEEHKRNIAESRKELAGQAIEKYGLTFKSSWEVDVADVLEEHGYDWEYEPETFQLGALNYTPDFRVDDTVIEVKGHTWRDTMEEKARRFMQQTDLKFVAVGAELPCDVHVAYNARDMLTEVIQ